MIRNKGVVLIFVMVFTTAISLLSLFMQSKSKNYIENFADIQKNLEIENMAEMGIEIGKILIDRRKGTLNTTGEESRKEIYYDMPDIMLHIIISDENAKINPNKIFDREKKETNSLLMEVYKNFFAVMGYTEVLSDSLLDWIDEDDIPRAAGAEYFHYKTSGFPYVPPNRNLYGTKELLLVKNFSKDIVLGNSKEKIPALIDFITSFSDGKINVNSCPPEILGAFGFSSGEAEKIVREREKRPLEERFLTETNRDVYIRNRNIMIFKSRYFLIRSIAVKSNGQEREMRAYVKKTDKSVETTRIEIE